MVAGTPWRTCRRCTLAPRAERTGPPAGGRAIGGGAAHPPEPLGLSLPLDLQLALALSGVAGETRAERRPGAVLLLRNLPVDRPVLPRDEPPGLALTLHP